MTQKKPAPAKTRLTVLASSMRTGPVKKVAAAMVRLCRRKLARKMAVRTVRLAARQSEQPRPASSTASNNNFNIFQQF